MQATLRMMYLNSCNIDEANRRREKEEMKEEIVQDVLSRISAMVDVSEIFDAIDALRRKNWCISSVVNWGSILMLMEQSRIGHLFSDKTQ